MAMSMKENRVNGVVFVCTLTILLGCFLKFYCMKRPYSAVIIKAAGYLPDTEAPEGADAITNATSEGGNTHVFADKLVEKLTALDIEAKVVDFSVLEGEQLAVNFMVFAGPTYGGKLPEQLQKLISEVVKPSKKTICSSLTSCGNPESGMGAVDHFNDLLTEAGLKTHRGIAVGRDIDLESLDKQIDDFATGLLAEIKK